MIHSAFARAQVGGMPRVSTDSNKPVSPWQHNSHCFSNVTEHTTVCAGLSVQVKKTGQFRVLMYHAKLTLSGSRLYSCV
jgi:hypothetical protein